MFFCFCYLVIFLLLNFYTMWIILLSQIIQFVLISYCDTLTLITLPNTAVTINCTLNFTCDLPSWKINHRLYSSYSLENSQTPYSVVDFGNFFLDNINSDFNGTTISCLSVQYRSPSNLFYISQGLQTTIIVASIPDKTPTPSYYIMTGCTIHLEWSAPFDNHKPIQYYTILLIEGFNATIINTTSPVINYSLQNILGGVSYTVSIAAVNVVGAGLFSDPLTFGFPIISPRPLCRLIYVTSDSIYLSWTLSYSIADLPGLNLAFLIKYSSLDSGENSIVSNASSLLLTSLKQDTMYSINITSFIPGFSNCIFNSSCNLMASTNITPANYANYFMGSSAIIFFNLFFLTLFIYV